MYTDGNSCKYHNNLTLVFFVYTDGKDKKKNLLFVVAVNRWAETELKLMDHFFADLVHFAESRNTANMSPNAL